MAESFHIRFEPPSFLYRDLIRALVEALVAHGWELKETTRADLSKSVSIKERIELERRYKKLLRKLHGVHFGEKRRATLQKQHHEVLDRLYPMEKLSPGSLDLVLELPPNPEGPRTSSFWATFSFAKPQTWIELDASFNKPGLIQLSSDESFFDNVDARSELKSLFSKIPFSRDTLIVGDCESWLEETTWIPIDPTSTRKTWIFKGRGFRYEFYWIQSLDSSQWNTLTQNFEDMKGNTLAFIDNRYLVMMGDSPFTPIDGRRRSSPRH